MLNHLLADEYANRLATRESLVGALGTNFSKLRELLERQVRGIDRRLNLLAWEIGLTGGCAMIDSVGPTKSTITAKSRLPQSLDETLTALIDLREFLVTRLRTAVNRRGDGCHGLLADLLACHERDTWMLCALRWEHRAVASGEEKK